jgi:uncharacterized membrane protein
MIDAILATKFVHDLAAAAMFGAWLAVAILMRLAHRSANTSVVALISRMVVRVEWMVMAGALAFQPISGIPLAWLIGLSPADDFWITLSAALYAAVVAAWIAALVVETRIRDLTHKAALDGVPLPDLYRRLYGVWRALAVLILAGMVGLFLLMVWQPRLD